jgi:hypothetical protein
MKKSLLPIAMLFAASVASAQTFNNGTTTYTESFTGATPTCLTTCCTSGGYQYTGGNMANTISNSNDANSMTIVAVAAPAAGVAPGYFDFMYTKGSGTSATCATLSANGYGVDLSDNTKAPKLVVVAKATVSGATVQFHIANSTNDGFPNVTTSSSGVPTSQTQITLTDTYATYTIDYSGAGWAAWTTNQKTAVNMWGILIPADNALNNNVGIKVQSIQVLAAVPTVVNDQVSLYPNPARGSFKVDMSAMSNSDAASIKVMNANGVIVKEISSNNSEEIIYTEGMNRGIYMVQVTSGNKIATKKVVVE